MSMGTVADVVAKGLRYATDIRNKKGARRGWPAVLSRNLGLPRRRPQAREQLGPLLGRQQPVDLRGETGPQPTPPHRREPVERDAGACRQAQERLARRPVGVA